MGITESDAAAKLSWITGFLATAHSHQHASLIKASQIKASQMFRVVTLFAQLVNPQDFRLTRQIENLLFFSSLLRHV